MKFEKVRIKFVKEEEGWIWLGVLEDGEEVARCSGCFSTLEECKKHAENNISNLEYMRSRPKISFRG